MGYKYKGKVDVDKEKQNYEMNLSMYIEEDVDNVVQKDERLYSVDDKDLKGLKEKVEKRVNKRYTKKDYILKYISNVGLKKVERCILKVLLRVPVFILAIYGLTSLITNGYKVISNYLAVYKEQPKKLSDDIVTNEVQKVYETMQGSVDTIGLYSGVLLGIILLSISIYIYENKMGIDKYITKMYIKIKYRDKIKRLNTKRDEYIDREINRGLLKYQSYKGYLAKERYYKV